MEKLASADGSFNLVWPMGQKRSIEARFVQRHPREVIVYLSSQYGCREGCRMCHLTRTGQTSDDLVEPNQFAEQANAVLEEADTLGRLRRAEVVNFNFMARGEPLRNPYVTSDLLGTLSLAARAHGLIPRFKISTIMPKQANLDLVKRFSVIHPDIYYSLYSVRDAFRKKWFPGAISVDDALAHLRLWQDHSHKIPKIHFALIAEQNDSIGDLVAMARTINRSGVRVDVNIVRYNPHETDGTFEGDYQQARRVMENAVRGAKVQVVERVGFDVKASCGMFV